jgi:hypothetical protein
MTTDKTTITEDVLESAIEELTAVEELLEEVDKLLEQAQASVRNVEVATGRKFDITIPRLDPFEAHDDWEKLREELAAMVAAEE